ncbi:MAG: NifU family protein [Synergistaceae bacterium]|jgi:Fe-S cluster biogenesis protein NfuA|nr:NifU family protein [Synergistaceae bacterium]
MPTALESIERVLDEKVRPALRAHDGGVGVVSLSEDGTLRVRLTGKCSNCPSAVFDVERLVEAELMASLPEVVTSVALVTGVSDELLDMARSLMKKRGNST